MNWASGWRPSGRLGKPRRTRSSEDICLRLALIEFVSNRLLARFKGSTFRSIGRGSEFTPNALRLCFPIFTHKTVPAFAFDASGLRGGFFRVGGASAHHERESDAPEAHKAH